MRSGLRFSLRRDVARFTAAAAAVVLVASGVSASRAPIRHRSQPAIAAPASVASALCAAGTAPAAAGMPAAAVAAAAGRTAPLPAYQEIVSPTEARPHAIRFGGATVVVPANAVRLPVGIGITPLAPGQVSKLDSGMTNVTGRTKGGFRFTPHPMQFLTPVEVSLPYDPALIGPEFTAQDVYTYFYDDVQLCWQVL